MPLEPWKLTPDLKLDAQNASRRVSQNTEVIFNPLKRTMRLSVSFTNKLYVQNVFVSVVRMGGDGTFPG